MSECSNKRIASAVECKRAFEVLVDAIRDRSDLPDELRRYVLKVLGNRSAAIEMDDGMKWGEASMAEIKVSPIFVIPAPLWWHRLNCEANLWALHHFSLGLKDGEVVPLSEVERSFKFYRTYTTVIDE